MTEYFPEITRWMIPEDLLEVAVSEMRLDGENGCEGTCLWLGTKAEGVAEITTTILLRGPGIKKHPANITIAPELMREVHEAAQTAGLVLIGQIHSHGRLYGLDLSPVDQSSGFRVPHFLSVVAPDYGLTWPITWTDCGVHVFQDGSFVRLQRSMTAKSLAITAATTSVMTIGDEH